jgi:hypothetical protein
MGQRVMVGLIPHLLGQTAGFGDVAEGNDDSDDAHLLVVDRGRRSPDGVFLAGVVAQDRGLGQPDQFACFEA